MMWHLRHSATTMQLAAGRRTAAPQKRSCQLPSILAGRQTRMRFVYCLRGCAPQSPVTVATSETARRRLIAGLDLPYFLAIVYHITLNHKEEYLNIYFNFSFFLFEKIVKNVF